MYRRLVNFCITHSARSYHSCSCDDVYAASEKLEKANVSFKKRPDEGRMKGLAFALDPDGYWVELVKRGEGSDIKNEFNFSQTMLRVKDPKKSIEFYKALGMKVLTERHFDDFSLYFLGSSNVSDEQEVKTAFQPVLELTHNHGSENDEDFKHYNGNEDGRQGFGHIGFLVDDVYKACDAIRPMEYGFRKEPDGGSMKGLGKTRWLSRRWWLLTWYMPHRLSSLPAYKTQRSLTTPTVTL